jgi:thymidylate kinase
MAPRFCVLLGPDHAGKSSVLAELAGAASPWHCVSVDDAWLAPEHHLLADLRRHLVRQVLPRVGVSYSGEFLAGLLQLAVLHLRDRVLAAGDAPVLVDSYYYKILAKCRLAGVEENPMFAWWRSFPRPVRVIYLDVAPATGWRRCGAGVEANPLEFYGDRPDWPRFAAYQTDLAKVMREETAHLPVTVVAEQDGVARTAALVREALADDLR